MSNFKSQDGCITPALLFRRTVINKNIQSLISIAGNPLRLRPHIKTHKTLEICKMMLCHGISKIKCATLAEAETAAASGIKDILIAYQLTAPQLFRLNNLLTSYSMCSISVLIDDSDALNEFCRIIRADNRQRAGIFLDINVGQDRCGTSPEKSRDLAKQIKKMGLKLKGIHGYDGHIHDSDVGERESKADLCIKILQDSLDYIGDEIDEVVIGGSPAFKYYADSTNWNLSPGTFVLWDNGYRTAFPDLPFEPAAFLKGRVISIPTEGKITLDLGTKALSSDGITPGVIVKSQENSTEDTRYKTAYQSEEHWVLETACEHRIGDILTALPHHICTTVNLFDEALIIDTESEESWNITRRRHLLCEEEDSK